MTERNQQQTTAEQEFPFCIDEQTIDSPAEKYHWLQTNRGSIVGFPVFDDLCRIFDPDHELKADRIRFDAEAGTLSVRLWNPEWWESETTEDYHQGCIENSPNGYHMHVEIV